MFPYIFLTITIILFFISLFVSIILILNTQDRNRMMKKIETFSSYLSLLEYHMLKAYDIIYKDKILIYSLEGIKINDSDFNMISKSFVKLVLKLLGENLTNELIELYGSEETLLINIVEYFNTKVENDEIRERAKDNIINNEETI